jgi:hypothetical protein
VDLTSWAACEAETRLARMGSRWSHARGVVRRAEEIASAVDVADRGVLVAAAYLHDIGYARELVVHNFHPLDGALWLRAQSQERLAGLVAHHSGAIFEARSHGLAERLIAFIDERSPVSDALAFSDLTTGPTGERVTVAERLGEIERRYGTGSLVVRALGDASPTLEAMVRRAEARLAGSRVDAA